MTIHAAIAPAKADIREPAQSAGLRDVALRYGLSAFGPIAVSGAHFVVSIIFLHAFSRTDFGLFAFLLVVVPFCLSLNGYGAAGRFPDHEPRRARRQAECRRTRHASERSASLSAGGLRCSPFCAFLAAVTHRSRRRSR